MWLVQRRVPERMLKGPGFLLGPEAQTAQRSGTGRPGNVTDSPVIVAILHEKMNVVRRLTDRLW